MQFVEAAFPLGADPDTGDTSYIRKTSSGTPSTEDQQMSRIAKAAVAAVVAAGLALGAGAIPAGAASASHAQTSSFSDTGWD
jgi:hypothetical protein